MSVNDTTSFGTAAPISAGAAPAPATPASPKWMGLQGQMALTISRSPASEILKTAHDAFKLNMAELQTVPDITYGLINIDNGKLTTLAAPALLICAVDKNRSLVGYHTVLLEAGCNPLEPITQNNNGINYIVERYTEQCYDRVYAQVVAEQIAENFPGYAVAQGAGTASYVPRGYNWTDANEVRKLVATALNFAHCDVLTANGTLTPINLVNDLGDASLQLRYSFGSDHIIDVIGRPVRADVTANVNLVSQQRQANTTVNTAGASTPLAMATAYIEPVWVGASPAGSGNGFGGTNVGTQRFVARAIVTSAASSAIQSSTASVLAHVIPALSLTESSNWLPAFRPNAMASAARGAVDPRDIGAINIEANLHREPNYGTPFETKSNSFGDPQLGQLISDVFYPEAVISLDVDVLGFSRAAADMFLQAAAGVQAAQQEILRAADDLTNGAFHTVFKGNQAVVVNEEVVLMGWYNTDAGKRDIREIDYLAVMNLAGRNDPSVGAAWSKATTDQSVALGQRLDSQRKMLRDLTGNTAVFTGTARRVTLTKDFVLGFKEALKIAGVNFSVINPAAGTDYSGQRPTFDWLNQARLGNASSGAFISGAGNQGAGQYGQAFTGAGRRW